MGAPKRVRISDQWYNVTKPFSTWELYAGADYPKYTMKEPYMHMNDFYWIYNSSGTQVGEIHTANRTYSGCVQAFES